MSLQKALLFCGLSEINVMMVNAELDNEYTNAICQTSLEPLIEAIYIKVQTSMYSFMTTG